ncbi:carboxymuconolactone decarboxylase family protein [Nocardia pneumoniae]|uniref:carboxymuconolactone decarboxylase family protein n=1 Tax=Nocardia pneumoniae TaxID=228601 RepID=UPI000309FF8B|nr:carboxymuconolactone decarboxylase family protein [Nocardia pneumoniae]
MSRLPLVSADTADAEQADLLTEVQRQLGRVPNLYAAMANSPATLRGYLGLRDALTRGKLSARTREQLALLVASENGCDYCVAAHTMRAGKMGFTEQAIADTRAARADDPHADAILRVARAVSRSRGRLDDSVLAAARTHGVSDAELTEVVGHIALNILSNYFNHVAEPELDFPPTAPMKGAPMNAQWRTATEVALVEGYSLLNSAGVPARTVEDVQIAIEGGFLHVKVSESADVQVVSAPAVAVVTYAA